MACKTDIYFLCDNTGSMLSKISAIQNNIISLLASIRALPDASGDPFDVAFGVGQFNDFPVSDIYVAYGGSFDPTTIVSVAIAPGATVTVPIGPGPLQYPPPNWSGAATVALGSSISSVTIPTSGSYRSIIQLRGDHGHSGGHLDYTIDGSVSGTVWSDFIDIAGGTPSYDPWNYSENSNPFDLVAGETLSHSLHNATSETVNIHWATLFCIEKDPDPFTGAPFALNHQLDIIDSDDTAVARAIRGWIGEGGGDPPESHLYSLDQLCGLINWRVGANRIIFIISSSPGHEVTCPTISGLAYTIDRASIIAKLQANGIRFVAMSTPVSGAGSGNDGVDDTFSLSTNDYDTFCGHFAVPANQGSDIANGTGGIVTTITSGFSDAFLSLITSITEVCREPVASFVTVCLVGAT